MCTGFGENELLQFESKMIQNFEIVSIPAAPFVNARKSTRDGAISFLF